MWQDAGGAMRGYVRAVDEYLERGEGFAGPEPKRRVRNLLEVSGVLAQLTPISPRLATVDEVQRVHTDEYVEKVRRHSATGGGLAGPGTLIGRGSFEIALLSAGGVLAAVDAVLDDDVDNAYALVRPPGHHAVADEGNGLCIFANLAIAVEHLRRVRGIDRIAVLDWDVHHGNGAQEIFYDDPDVLTVSIHQANVQVGRSLGSREERGGRRAPGSNINVPLPPGSGRDAYLTAMDRVVLPALRRFRPSFVLIASGLDAGAYDPTGRMMLWPDAFRAMTAAVAKAAGELCGGRLVAVHEGGYSDFMAPFCGLAVISTLRGVRSEAETAFDTFPRPEADQLLQPHQRAAIDAAERCHLPVA
jgi:acetoin utilization deacetylase AcuC-like enzyme